LCHVDRFATTDGHCRTGAQPVVSSYGPHFGEEAPLVGRGGSGTIFFTSCNLHCVFCQNWDISHDRLGTTVTERELGAMMLVLQARGCHNINVVTPSHMIAQLLAGLAHAVEGGLSIPIVYNTGGYDLVSSLRLLDGVVDIYMPDIKFLDAAPAARYLGAPDYPEVVQAAVKEMHRQVGDLVIDERGVAVRGLLVRHLVMPGGAAGTRAVTRFLAREISPDTYLNVMDQYRPCGHARRYPEIAGAPGEREFEGALDACRAEGLRRLDHDVGRRFRWVVP
jgi:putative pyruvate formate lyase activating enzyme